MIEVRTQAQLDKALRKTNGGKDELVVCLGGGHFVLRESSSAVLRESSSAVLRESSSARALSAQCKAEASKYAVVLQHNPAAKISGGRILEMPRPETGVEWCEFYGVEIRKGGSFTRKLAGQDVAILFKAVGEGYKATRDLAYRPGSTPAAPDWDGGSRECGGGLHFSPHPKMAKEFVRVPAHFVACPVLVSEIVVHPDGTYPQKVKAPRVAAPCWEVDENGEKVEGD